MSSTHTTRPKIKTGNPSPKNSSHTPSSTQKISHPHTTSQIVPNSHTIYQNYPIRVRDRVRPHPCISTQNKFSDNYKSPIFTQNYLLHITISLAKSNNLRSPLEVIALHNKFNLHTIPNNLLHLNPAISQIPLPHLPKMQQSLPIKSTHHSPISIKIITKNTSLEVHNFTSSGNTHLNCVKV